MLFIKKIIILFVVVTILPINWELFYPLEESIKSNKVEAAGDWELVYDNIEISSTDIGKWTSENYSLIISPDGYRDRPCRSDNWTIAPPGAIWWYRYSPKGCSGERNAFSPSLVGEYDPRLYDHKIIVNDGRGGYWIDGDQWDPVTSQWTYVYSQDDWDGYNRGIGTTGEIYWPANNYARAVRQGEDGRNAVTVYRKYVAEPPSISGGTATVNNNTKVATVSYTIPNVGKPNAIEHGFVWATNPSQSLTIGTANKLSMGEIFKSGNYQSSMTLTDGVMYYARPYVTNLLGTFYGTPVTFSLNQTPILTLSTPNNVVLNNDSNTTYTVKGTVKDADNDSVTVSATIDGITKKMTLSNTAVAKSFSIPFDIITDEIAEGNNKMVVVTADDGRKGIVTDSSLRFHIQARLGNGVYILKDTTIYEYPAKTYSDSEDHPMYQEQYKFEHEPGYYNNNNGLFEKNNEWLLVNTGQLPITNFSKVGKYKLDYRAKDNPINDDRFDEFRKWSSPAQNYVNFFIHRKPTADFGIKLVPNGANFNAYVKDYSYDIDNLSKPNFGIRHLEWKYREVGQENWIKSLSLDRTSTDEFFIGTLPPNRNYEVEVRVRDIDGVGGIGVWSDPIRKLFTSSNPPPSGFTVTPKEGPRGTTFTITPNAGVGAYNPLYTIKRNADQYQIYNANQSGSFSVRIDPLISNRDYYTIRQVVTTGGVTSEHIETISVYNRKPTINSARAEGMELATTANSKTTVFNQSRPTFAWKYQDTDYDNQKYFRMTVRELSNQIVASSGIVNHVISPNTLDSWRVPSDLSENTTYKVEFEVHDGYEWSSVYTRFFQIVLNQPPKAVCRIDPSPTDRITDTKFISESTDREDAVLDHYWEIRKSGTSTWNILSTQPNPTHRFSDLGTFDVRLRVTDSGGLSDTCTTSVEVRNSPPIADFTLHPAKPFEGDTLTAIDASYDVDGDAIVMHEWEVLQPNGKTIRSNQKDITIFDSLRGTYYFRKRVGDDQGKQSRWTNWKTLTVGELKVTGQVKHTSKWNQNRINYNQFKTGTNNNPRGYNVFWAGEKFVLEAYTTDTQTTTKATNVTVRMDGGFSTTLSPTNVSNTHWDGSLYHSSFENLKNGPLRFIFKATWNNGTVKEDVVEIQIDNKWTEYYPLHRNY